MLSEHLDCRGFAERIREISQSRMVGASTVKIEKKCNIYSCGQVDSNVYFVECGQVKRSMYSREGKVCLLSVHGPWEIFGESCLFSPVRDATACAMKNSVLRKIPAARFLTALGQEGLLEEFIRHLMGQMAEQQKMIIGFVTMDSQRRLAAVLLQLGHKFGQRRPQGLLIDERFTQEELSCIVGTTRSRVGFFLKQFGDDGMLEFNCDGLILLKDRQLANYVALAA